MKLIVGIGNPGDKFKNTRHNIGFRIVDVFRRRKSDGIADFNFVKKFEAEIAKNDELIIAKPQTFMNNSGISVSRIARFYKILTSNIYIIHDDLDIRFGEYKIQKGIGPKIHYGVQSIENNIGEKNFWRVRVGIDNRDLKNRIEGEEYVLQKFNKDEMSVLDDVQDTICDDLLEVIG